MAERVGFERFTLLQGKDLSLESIASPDEYLNFRRGIAHVLAHVGRSALREGSRDRPVS